MQRKEYKLPNGKTAVFEYDGCGIGKITLECMDKLMSIITDRPRGEWIEGRYVDPEWISPTADFYKCSICGKIVNLFQMRSYSFCPNCGARMKGADDEAN